SNELARREHGVVRCIRAVRAPVPETDGLGPVAVRVELGRDRCRREGDLNADLAELRLDRLRNVLERETLHSDVIREVQRDLLASVARLGERGLCGVDIALVALLGVDRADEER